MPHPNNNDFLENFPVSPNLSNKIYSSDLGTFFPPYQRPKAATTETHQCPVCKSQNTKENAQYQSNGIYGPGSTSWKTSSYWFCKDCGVMFHPINKEIKENKENEPSN